MGYDPADSDPYQAVRRQMAADAAAAREAQSPGGTQPFQAVRKLQAQVTDLFEITAHLQEVDSDLLEIVAHLQEVDSDLFDLLARVQQTESDLIDLVTRLPQVQSASDVQSGFGLNDVASGAWKTVAQVVLTAPADKDRVVVQATGQGSVLDRTSGGATSSKCRIVINGSVSAVIPAAKDAGASMVDNVLVVSSVLEITPLPSTVTVQFQMSPLNPAAFGSSTSNIANLSVYAGYSVV